MVTRGASLPMDHYQLYTKPSIVLNNQDRANGNYILYSETLNLMFF